MAVLYRQDVISCRSVLYSQISNLFTLHDHCVNNLLQHWTRINKLTGVISLFRSVEWPEKKYNHAATCVSGPLLVIVGGGSGQSTISDCWIYDLTTKQWKKVCVCNNCSYRHFQDLYILQLLLPDFMMKRVFHSLSAIQLSSHSVLLVVFGGWRLFGSDKLSHTVCIKLS